MTGSGPDVATLSSTDFRRAMGHFATGVTVITSVDAGGDPVRHRPGSTGSPRLHDVIASLECTVEHRLPGGDHEIVVGRVTEVEVANGDDVPLLFWRGSYAALDHIGDNQKPVRDAA